MILGMIIVINFSRVVSVKRWKNEMHTHRKQQLKCYRGRGGVHMKKSLWGLEQKGKKGKLQKVYPMRYKTYKLGTGVSEFTEEEKQNVRGKILLLI